MPFVSYLVQAFDTTAEREIFDKLVDLLSNKYDSSDEYALLIGNFSCEGKELDAVFIKSDAISVIEFKNYGGSLKFSENGDWEISNTIVKGGSGGKNPYRQIKDNKFALLNTLSLLVDLKNVDLGHITGIVMFHMPVEFDELTISPKIKTWFHVTDINHIVKKLNQITSPKIRLSYNDFESIVFRLNLINCVNSGSLKQKLDSNTEEYLDVGSLPIEKNDSTLDNFLQKHGDLFSRLGIDIVDTLTLPSKDPQYRNLDGLGLSHHVNNFLKEYNNQVYHHQYDGLKLYKERSNFCLATSTSSGKSDVFFMCGIELLSNNPDAKIIAVYPLKALGNQQNDRWKAALARAGLEHFGVGRIDGSIPSNMRFDILNKSSVTIMTPDVIHSWLLTNLENSHVQNYLRYLKLIVIDEIHNYTGVFGSNSSFLFRRLNHAASVMSGSIPLYIGASATIESPDKHLLSLTGLDFEIVDMSRDTSGRQKIDVFFLNPKNANDTLTATTELIRYFSTNTEHQSITFLDSRKMVEQVATIVNNFNKNNPQENDEADDNDQALFNIPELQVYPYRSGYEREDAERIQRYLREGTLRGVVSTSALEMGIDIAGLDLGILLGIPISTTSYLQRIGRIGRHKDGIVLIINDHSMRTMSVFSNPQEIMNIPLAEGALYLENEYLQYIHCLCFASTDQEFDKLNNSEDFIVDIPFPDRFIERCRDERSGIVPSHLQHLKTQVEVKPQWTYPLRDLEPQFSVSMRRGQQNVALGSMSYSQAMREAYPHAVYYYMGNPYRVKIINIRNKTIQVVHTRHYTTKPIFAPTLIFPNLTSGNVYFGKKYGDLKIVESSLQVSINIIGVNERRGNTEQITNYPFDKGADGSFNQNKFTRNYFTSGVIISHPILSNERVQNDIISQIIYEIFLVVNPFEPQDISNGKDKIRSDKLDFRAGDRFICIYDQTYGSLRLTSRLTEFDITNKIFKKAVEIFQDPDNTYTIKLGTLINEETIEALKVMYMCLENTPENIYLDEDSSLHITGLSRQEIILPYHGTGIGTGDWNRSKGVNPTKGNEEFYVARLINSTENGENKLYYLGYYISNVKFDENDNIIMNNSNPPTRVYANSIRAFGDSKTAIYDLELQDIVPD